MLSLILTACTRSVPPRPPEETVGDTDTTCVVVDASDTGDTFDPQDTGDGPPLTWVQVDVDLLMGCGITSDGTVRCWGSPECVARAPPPSTALTQISVGGSHGCGLRPDGTLLCWCCDTPTPYLEVCSETPSGEFVRVELGSAAGCAQDAAGVLTCWGNELVVGAPPLEPVVDFAMDANYSAAVLLDGSVRWWGLGNLWGSGEKPPEGVIFTDIALGRRHACGLDVDGTAHCWGDDLAEEPWPDPPPGTWAQIEGFHEATCVIDAAGIADCWWGIDWLSLEVWAIDMPAGPWAQIGLGEWDGCGVTLAGEAYCWGHSPYPEPWLDVPVLPPG